MNFFLGLIASISGALLPVQAAINSMLGKLIGGPITAAFISFGTGTLWLFLYLVLTQTAWSFASVASVPWWLWLGGLMGAFYVAMAAVLIPVLGAATMIGFVLFGQLLISVIMDHFGWFDLPRHELNPMRILGLGFLALGVFLIKRF